MHRNLSECEDGVFEEVVMLKEKEFLDAFKEEFWYQARIKFGRSDETSAFEKYWRPSKIILYISALCFFTYYHHEILHNLLVLVGYIWTSKICIIRFIGYINSSIV